MKHKGLQLIILDKRLHFETPNNAESHCWFASAWFTNGLNLPKDIMFGELTELNQLLLTPHSYRGKGKNEA